MQTQIVYAVISREDDYFLEELWVSVYSLRLFHPDAKVVVCTDCATGIRLRAKSALHSLISEVVEVDVPEEYNSKQRSRVLKTSIRSNIIGAYLFLDTDTVICSPLDEIDNIGCDIACVPEFHVPLLNHPAREVVGNTVKSIFGDDCSGCTFFFNSGVMYVADNSLTRSFCNRWYENWRFSCFEKGNSQDQPALLMTDKEFGFVIKELPGDYNCQVTMNICNYHTARILHFVHSAIHNGQTISPFIDKRIYEEVARANGITESVAYQIANVRSCFSGISTIFGMETIQFLYSATGQIAFRLYYKNERWQKMLNKAFHRLDQLSRLPEILRRELNRR